MQQYENKGYSGEPQVQYSQGQPQAYPVQSSEGQQPYIVQSNAGQPQAQPYQVNVGQPGYTVTTQNQLYYPTGTAVPGQPQTVVHITMPGHHHGQDVYDRYRGCCCHVTTCVYVIGAFELVGLLAAIITAATGPQMPGALPGTIVGFVIGVAVVVAMFFGVAKEQPLLLIPHIVFQSIGFAGLGIAIILLGILAAAAAGGSFVASDYGYYYTSGNAAIFIAAIIILIVVLIALIIEIVFMVEVVKCFRYLKEKQRCG